MKRILFFTTSSYPNPNANGICVNQISQELINKGIEVHLICFRKLGEPKKSVVDGINIYRVNNSFSSNMKDLSENINNINLSELVRYIAYFMSRFKMLLYFPLFPVSSILTIISFYKLAVKLHKEINFDTVISSYKPIEGLIASNLLKKRYSNIKLGMYVLDSLTNTGEGKILSSDILDKLGWKWEKRFYKDADLILNMKTHKKHHEKHRYNPYRYKMELVDIPLLIRPRNYEDDNIEENKDISIVYSGSLYKVTRDPKYSCEIFKRIYKDIYQLDFYSRGDCEEILDKYQVETNGMITRNGYIPHGEMLSKINSASFLLSIGNKNSDMIPSKIFEYMSTGKPIIHFYDNEQDSSLPYLKQYPLALLIKQDPQLIDSNVIKVDNFLEKNAGSSLSFREIEKKFTENSPEYTVDKIMKI